MKEIEAPKADPVAPARLPELSAGNMRHAPSVPVPGPAAIQGGLLTNPDLAHPANARPLAEVVQGLQASQGNRFVQAAVAASGGGGQVLDGATRAAAEAALGQDLSHVRVHTGAEDQAAVAAAGARAFTRSSDIYFGQGEYNPATRAGQELLAHELAHVAQQRASANAIQTAGVQPTHAEFEQEAEAAVPAILAGQSAQIARRQGAPSLQRKEKEPTPSITEHGQEIMPLPPAGTVAAGQFTVAYHYLSSAGADQMTLTLAVPAGVAVSAVPLTETSDYRVIDSGGNGARAVLITVSAHMRAAQKIQVTFHKGSYTYIVIFQFPAGKASKT